MPTEKEKKELKTPSNDGLTIVLLVALGLAAIVLILIYRPDSDPVVICTGVGTFIAAIMAYLKNQQTHDLVNSRASEQAENARNAGRLEGIDIGRNLANDRTDMLAKKK